MEFGKFNLVMVLMSAAPLLKVVWLVQVVEHIQFENEDRKSYGKEKRNSVRIESAMTVMTTPMGDVCEENANERRDRC